MKTSQWLSRAGLLALGLALLPTAAHAGRRPFTWAYDTTIVPDGEMELEQWLWMRGRNVEDPQLPAHYWIWWGPVFGIGDHLELNLPFQIISTGGGGTWLDDFEVDLRYRLKPRLNNDNWQTLFRVAYHIPTAKVQPYSTVSSGNRIDVNIVNSYDFDSGVHLTLDLGGKIGLAPLTAAGGEASFLGTVDLGAAYPVGDEVRLAAETFAEVPIANYGGTAHWFAGPSVEWTRGRMWITAGVLVGLTPLLPETPRLMPRIIWAVSL